MCQMNRLDPDKRAHVDHLADGFEEEERNTAPALGGVDCCSRGGVRVGGY
jgi:hypothetical protein